MTATATAARPEELVAPPEGARFYRRIRLTAALREAWNARELVRTLAEREYRIRYKQAVLGFAWAVLTPLALMLVFTLVFQHVAKVPQKGADYPVFAYLGLLPWTFFATSINQGGLSLVTNVHLLNKVYCPREVFPFASIGVAAMDTIIGMSGLVVLMVIFQTAPQVTTYWVPLLVVIQLAFTVGVTLIASAVIVYLRDLRYALPVALQFGLFATPVGYALSAVPENLRTAMVILNPLAAVIDGYRRAVLFGQPPQWGYLAMSAVTSAVTLVVGYLLFKRLEAGIADVA